METRQKLWINGGWVIGQERRTVKSPYSGKPVAEVEFAGPAQVEQALAAAAAALPLFRGTSRYLRSRVLALMASIIDRRREEFITCVIEEAGKPRQAAIVELNRAVATFTAAAEEAKRFGGELIPLDGDGASTAYLPAQSYWVSRGVALGITPFNFPVNLVAHKIAPALAAGAPVIIRPASQTPGGAHLLAEAFDEALRTVQGKGETIPAAALQVVSCSTALAETMIKDPRVATVSFTGSGQVGWGLQAKAVGKRVILELGGNAAVVIHRDADLKRAASRAAQGGFGYAGQSCISVQRIYVHEEALGEFRRLFLAEVAKCEAGDPARAEVVVGPVIDSGAADRLMSWITEARGKGAELWAGGTRSGNVIAPTVLAKVDPALPISCDEAFGPVVTVSSYREFGDALNAVNTSRYGLQAGVFTESQGLIQRAIRELEVGGICINEVPTFRSDVMPYGGVKESGLGREGVRYAMEEYSERRTVVIWDGEKTSSALPRS